MLCNEVTGAGLIPVHFPLQILEWVLLREICNPLPLPAILNNCIFCLCVREWDKGLWMRKAEFSVIWAEVHHWKLQQFILIMMWPRRRSKTYQPMCCFQVRFVHTLCMEHKKVMKCIHIFICHKIKAILLYSITQAWCHEMKQKISQACFFSKACVLVQSPRFLAYQMQTKWKETVPVKTAIDTYIAWCSVEWDWNVFFNNEY